MISFSSLAAVAAVAVAAAAVSPAAARYGQEWSVVQSGSQLEVKAGFAESAVARGFFDAGSNRTGWNRLQIVTDEKFPDEVQMRAAGFLEGYVTQDSIWWSWQNWVANQHWTAGAPPAHVKEFMTTNKAWVESQAHTFWKGRGQGDDLQQKFWVQQYLVLRQLAGLAEGFAAANSNGGRQMSEMDFFLLQTQGDIETLGAMDTLSRTGAPDSDMADYEEALEKFDWNPIFHEHCSSLIKHTDDGQELFAGHATWSGWGTMLRTYKTYEFHLANNTKGPHHQKHGGVSFSAYPGTLSSIDDWYVTSQNIVITETTNGIMNKTLLAQVKPQAVLSWQRVIVANRLAVDGKGWVDLFSVANSGTYNNQWIIVDYNKFRASPNGKKQPLDAGTLTIAEQIPGYIESGDMTPFLNTHGYWPSYNIPYFKTIFDRSGFPSMVEKYGAWFSYEGSPRAQIFKRDQGAVDSLGTYQFIMRYNNWAHDPLSKGNAGNGIASRFDLVTGPAPTNPFLKKACFGAMDAKVTSAALMEFGRGALAISGPTFYEQPAFTFDEPICANVVRTALPTKFNFGWHHFSADGRW